MIESFPVRIVLFDLDGTLIDSRHDLAAAVNEALKVVGQPIQTEAQITPHVGNGVKKLLADVMGSVPDEILDRGVDVFSTYYEQHCVDATVLYDGVKETLRELAKTARLGVVTNKPKFFSDKILKALGVSQYFGTVIGGDTLPERKPHPAPVLKAVKDLGGEVKNTVFLGDGYQDMEAGRAAGTQICSARYGYGFNPKLLTVKPEYSIDHFKDIKDLVTERSRR